jgi:hypothetical protein
METHKGIKLLSPFLLSSNWDINLLRSSGVNKIKTSVKTIKNLLISIENRFPRFFMICLCLMNIPEEDLLKVDHYYTKTTFYAMQKK